MPGIPGESGDIPLEDEQSFVNPFAGIPWEVPTPKLYAMEILELQKGGLISVDEARDLLNDTYELELS